MKAKPISEEALQLQVIKWMRWQYPNVVAISDLSGVKLTGRQAATAKNLKTHLKIPDLTIYASRLGFGALLLELKKSSDDLIIKGNQDTKRKLDGLGLWKNEHVFEQYQMILKLQDEGFAAMFCTSFEDAIFVISNYLNENNKFLDHYERDQKRYQDYCN